MLVELLYTSAPSGLKQGSKGFCTVLSSTGMPVNLAQRLEALSGYRHVFAPQDPRTDDNPVCYSHLRFVVGGRQYSVLSRIAAYGIDYSQRTNKLAHHIVLESSREYTSGPAWLLQQDGVMRKRWDGQCVTLNKEPHMPRGTLSPAVCATWQKLAGDAGWAGLVIDTWLKPTAGRPVWIIFDLQDRDRLLQLMNEAIALLPESKRWQATFTTYFTNLPPDVDCRVRFVLAGTDEAKLAPARGTAIDLTKPTKCNLMSSEAECARSGSAIYDESSVARQKTQAKPQKIQLPTATQTDKESSNFASSLPPRCITPPELDLRVPPPEATVANPFGGLDSYSPSQSNNKRSNKLIYVGISCFAALLLIGLAALYTLSNYYNVSSSISDSAAKADQSPSISASESAITSAGADVPIAPHGSDANGLSQERKTDSSSPSASKQISIEIQGLKDGKLKCPEVTSDSNQQIKIAEIFLHPETDATLELDGSDALTIIDRGLYRKENATIDFEKRPNTEELVRIVAKRGNEVCAERQFELAVENVESLTKSDLRFSESPKVLGQLSVVGDVTDEDFPNFKANEFEIVSDGEVLLTVTRSPFKVPINWQGKKISARLKYDANRIMLSTALTQTEPIQIESLPLVRLSFDDFISDSKAIEVRLEIPFSDTSYASLRVNNHALEESPVKLDVLLKTLKNGEYHSHAVTSFNTSDRTILFTQLEIPRHSCEFLNADAVKFVRNQLRPKLDAISSRINEWNRTNGKQAFWQDVQSAISEDALNSQRSIARLLHVMVVLATWREYYELREQEYKAMQSNKELSSDFHLKLNSLFEYLSKLRLETQWPKMKLKYKGIQNQNEIGREFDGSLALKNEIDGILNYSELENFCKKLLTVSPDSGLIETSKPIEFAGIPTNHTDKGAQKDAEHPVLLSLSFVVAREDMQEELKNAIQNYIAIRQ